MNIEAYLFDSEGQVIYCKYGVPAETAMIGREAYLARCNECMSYEESPCNLVYRPPIDDKRIESVKKMLDSWGTNEPRRMGRENHQVHD